ncbi:MAG: hypothetical protein NVSMB25_19050 [Thermoleophilaceae bacterium]
MSDAAEETTLDLTGVLCPLTWVRARLALEQLEPGDRLCLTFDDDEALASVPRSAREEGHAVEVSGATVRIVKVA